MENDRLEVYGRCREQIKALCENESDEVARMASFVGVLHNAVPEFYWTGFYRVVESVLVIGPYQGTVGCLRIDFGRGVCGTAAQDGETQVVADVHDFPGHIACDARSQSEIVVPVRNGLGELIAVLDIDSLEINTFNQDDRAHLEEMVAMVFGQK